MAGAALVPNCHGWFQLRQRPRRQLSSRWRPAPKTVWAAVWAATHSVLRFGHQTAVITHYFQGPGVPPPALALCAANAPPNIPPPPRLLAAPRCACRCRPGLMRAPVRSRQSLVRAIVCTAALLWAYREIGVARSTLSSPASWQQPPPPPRARARRLAHQSSAPTCRVASFKESDPASCRDSYSTPFSGCLSDACEEETFERLLFGKPVSNLRCGFLDATSHAWLTKQHARFSRCKYIVFTAAFSYGTLPDTDHVVGKQAGICFVAFVDRPGMAGLRQQTGFSRSRFKRWQLVIVHSTMLSGTVARSSHMLRTLAPRLFPTALYSLYIDIKVHVPADPLAVIRAVEQHPSPVVVATARHFDPNRDVFREMIAVFVHLAERRLNMTLRGAHVAPDATKQAAYIKGITGRDFHDIFRQYMLFADSGYPMHRTGMFDAAVLVWNHQNPCTAALACLWHNQIAYYSMRVQLNFNYVASMLGLTDQVFFLDPFSYHFKGLNFTLQPTNWPAFGSAGPDDFW